MVAAPTGWSHCCGESTPPHQIPSKKSVMLNLYHGTVYWLCPKEMAEPQQVFVRLAPG